MIGMPDGERSYLVTVPTTNAGVFYMPGRAILGTPHALKWVVFRGNSSCPNSMVPGGETDMPRSLQPIPWECNICKRCGTVFSNKKESIAFLTASIRFDHAERTPD